MMLRSDRDKVVEALRSGGVPQIWNQAVTEDGMCAGMLAAVTLGYQPGFQPTGFCDYLGHRGLNGTWLVDLNDNQKLTFEEIADEIEKKHVEVYEDAIGQPSIRFTDLVMA